MDKTERKYGYIIFPETGEKVDHVWLNITVDEIYLEANLINYNELSWSIIKGVFNGLNEVTFINVHISNGTNGIGGANGKLIVNWMIKNQHFNTVDELKFDSISFREFAMKKWVRENFSIEKNDLVFTLPNPIQPLLFESENLKIIWELAHFAIYNFQDAEINMTSTFKIELSNHTTWIEVIKLVEKIKKLIIFITNLNPKIDSFHLCENLEVIFRKTPLFESRFPSSISLNYSETKSLLPFIFKTWFEDGKLEPITDLVLEKHFHENIPLHRHFFNIAVGLEAFHENFISKKVKLSDESIKLNKERITDLIKTDIDLLNWFRKMSSNWERPSLKDRMINLMDTIDQVADGIFEFETLNLITMIVKTRNSIAHAGIYNKQFKGDIELRLVTKILEFVLRLEIYKLLKIDWKSNRTDKIKEANSLIKVMAKLNNFKIVALK